MCAAVLRSLGDSRTPVSWLIFASVINIILDIIFIVVFKMDVFGAALATVTAQLISGLGCLYKVCRGFPILSMTKQDMKPSPKHIGHLLAMGIPMGLQYSITAIGAVILQTAVNHLGTMYVTAVTAGLRLSAFMCCPFDAMGSTMATYMGQNSGARKWDRLNMGLASCTLIGLIYSAVIYLVILLTADRLALIFLDSNSIELVPLVKQYLCNIAAFYFPLALVNIVRFSIQGMGFSPIATLAGVLEMLGRGTAAYFVGTLGFTAACFADPTAWIFADVFLIPAYFLCKKRLIKKMQI